MRFALWNKESVEISQKNVKHQKINDVTVHKVVHISVSNDVCRWLTKRHQSISVVIRCLWQKRSISTFCEHSVIQQNYTCPCDYTMLCIIFYMCLLQRNQTKHGKYVAPTSSSNVFSDIPLSVSSSCWVWKQKLIIRFFFMM